MNLGQNTSLEIILGGAVTTNQLQWTCSYSEVSQTCCEPIQKPICTMPAESQGNTNNASVVTMVSAPSAEDSANQTVVRVVSEISVNNKDTANATVTIQINNGINTKTVFNATLASGDQILYTID